MSTEKRGDALITRLVERCAADERIVAAFLGGSRVRGGADDHSDYDISLVAVDASYGELIAEKDGFVRLLGQPLFLEDFGNESVAFVIFADGVELELLFFREGDMRSVRSGPHRVLYDQAGMLSGLEFPPPIWIPPSRCVRSGTSCSGSGTISVTSPRRSNADSSGGRPESSSSSAITA